MVRWISLRFSMPFVGHRRWLRATIFMFTVFTVIVRFHVLGIVELPKTKPYRLRGCTEIVHRLCDDRRADILRSYNFCMMLFCSPVEKKNGTLAAWSAQGLRTMTLRSYDATYDVFKGYDLTILENLYNSALNKIVEATETVIVVCHPREIVRLEGYD